MCKLLQTEEKILIFFLNYWIGKLFCRRKLKGLPYLINVFLRCSVLVSINFFCHARVDGYDGGSLPYLVL